MAESESDGRKPPKIWFDTGYESAMPMLCAVVSVPYTSPPLSPSAASTTKNVVTRNLIADGTSTTKSSPR